MKKIITIFFFIFFIQSAEATLKEKIITNLENINNLTFNFKQTINDKSEIGNCVIKYPKKIFCSYSNLNKKIMVSNGKSLVIKNKNINQYYIYSLEKTPLALILDKKYLINQIKNLESRIIDKKYINFKIINNKYEINVFFDKKNLILIGWQTEDIYQNLVVTFISDIKLNQNLNNDIFKLPKMD
ncbi:outer-membrane lipoprotein carrier protein LolA [Candidatus Pelagibacter sp.]|nr:outer-membrane lipoprotein carrier protein LolA [Candidatus Pelagibacter sp.]